MGPACPRLRKEEGRREEGDTATEVRPGRRKRPCGTAFLVWMDHITPGDSGGAAGVAGAGPGTHP